MDTTAGAELASTDRIQPKLHTRGWMCLKRLVMIICLAILATSRCKA
jgi:hypothetical protein